ncbi:MAG: thiamine diphosphokinase [Rhodobacteraceae bacterium]|nr:thiamine diphosphokinase [Paracoccaceae bacterium]
MSAPAPILCAAVPVTLAGGGKLRARDLTDCLARAPHLVAADGGADAALALGHRPEAVIGDMDSLSPEGRAVLGQAVLHQIAEQDSTDFEKCLTRIVAPLVLAAGFMGRRMDHALAVLNTLARHPHRRCVLVGKTDIALLMPPRIDLPLHPGTRVSLFPLVAMGGRSRGLEWPLDGIGFAPAGPVGTSNRAAGPVRLEFDTPGMLLFLPRDCLDLLLEALKAAPEWPES